VADEEDEHSGAETGPSAKVAPNWARLHLKWGEALLYSGRGGEAEKQFAIASNLDLSTSDRAALARARAHHG